MNEVSLQIYLTHQPSMLDVVFPLSSALEISASELLEKVTFELDQRAEREVQTRDMFERYVLEIEKVPKGTCI